MSEWADDDEIMKVEDFKENSNQGLEQKNEDEEEVKRLDTESITTEVFSPFEELNRSIEAHIRTAEGIDETVEEVIKVSMAL